MSRCAATLILLLLWVCPHLAYAKRTPAPKVDPVVYEGVRFTAPNDNGRRAYFQAWNAETGKKLWEVTVCRNFSSILPLGRRSRRTTRIAVTESASARSIWTNDGKISTIS